MPEFSTKQRQISSIRRWLERFNSAVNFRDEFMDDYYTVKTIPVQLYFEYKAKLKHVENLWDLYESSLRQSLKDKEYFEVIEPADADRYFKAVAKVKMALQKYESVNKVQDKL